MHQQDPAQRLGKIHVTTLLCATLLATLAVFAVNQSSLGQQGGSTNCDPTVALQNKAPQNSSVPCSSATCVLWSSDFGTSSQNTQLCPQGGATPGSPVSKYSLSVTALNWTNCKTPTTTSTSQPPCREGIAPCGNWTFYVDAVNSPNGECRLECGSSSTIGYCKAGF